MSSGRAQHIEEVSDDEAVPEVLLSGAPRTATRTGDARSNYLDEGTPAMSEDEGSVPGLVSGDDSEAEEQPRAQQGTRQSTAAERIESRPANGGDEELPALVSEEEEEDDTVSADGDDSADEGADPMDPYTGVSPVDVLRCMLSSPDALKMFSQAMGGQNMFGPEELEAMMQMMSSSTGVNPLGDFPFGGNSLAGNPLGGISPAVAAAFRGMGAEGMGDTHEAVGNGTGGNGGAGRGSGGGSGRGAGRSGAASDGFEAFRGVFNRGGGRGGGRGGAAGGGTQGGGASAGGGQGGAAAPGGGANRGAASMAVDDDDDDDLPPLVDEEGGTGEEDDDMEEMNARTGNTAAPAAAAAAEDMPGLVDTEDDDDDGGSSVDGGWYEPPAPGRQAGGTRAGAGGQAAAAGVDDEDGPPALQSDDSGSSPSDSEDEDDYEDHRPGWGQPAGGAAGARARAAPSRVGGGDDFLSSRGFSTGFFDAGSRPAGGPGAPLRRPAAPTPTPTPQQQQAPRPSTGNPPSTSYSGMGTGAKERVGSRPATSNPPPQPPPGPRQQYAEHQREEERRRRQKEEEERRRAEQRQEVELAQAKELAANLEREREERERLRREKGLVEEEKAVDDPLLGRCALEDCARADCNCEVRASHTERFHVRCSAGHKLFWHKDCWRKARVHNNGAEVEGKYYKWGKKGQDSPCVMPGCGGVLTYAEGPNKYIYLEDQEALLKARQEKARQAEEFEHKKREKRHTWKKGGKGKKGYHAEEEREEEAPAPEAEPPVQEEEAEGAAAEEEAPAPSPAKQAQEESAPAFQLPDDADLRAMKRESDDEEMLVAGRRRRDKGKAPLAEAEIVYDDHKPDRRKKKGTTLHWSELAGGSDSLAAQRRRVAAGEGVGGGEEVEGGYEDILNGPQQPAPEGSGINPMDFPDLDEAARLAATKQERERDRSADALLAALRSFKVDGDGRSSVLLVEKVDCKRIVEVEGFSVERFMRAELATFGAIKDLKVFEPCGAVVVAYRSEADTFKALMGLTTRLVVQRKVLPYMLRKVPTDADVELAKQAALDALDGDGSGASTSAAGPSTAGIAGGSRRTPLGAASSDGGSEHGWMYPGPPGEASRPMQIQLQVRQLGGAASGWAGGYSYASTPGSAAELWHGMGMIGSGSSSRAVTPSGSQGTGSLKATAREFVPGGTAAAASAHAPGSSVTGFGLGGGSGGGVGGASAAAPALKVTASEFKPASSGLSSALRPALEERDPLVEKYISGQLLKTNEATYNMYLEYGSSAFGIPVAYLDAVGTILGGKIGLLMYNQEKETILGLFTAQHKTTAEGQEVVAFVRERVLGPLPLEDAAHLLAFDPVNRGEPKLPQKLNSYNMAELVRRLLAVTQPPSSPPSAPSSDPVSMAPSRQVSASEEGPSRLSSTSASTSGPPSASPTAAPASVATSAAATPSQQLSRPSSVGSAAAEPAAGGGGAGAPAAEAEARQPVGQFAESEAERKRREEQERADAEMARRLQEEYEREALEQQRQAEERDRSLAAQLQRLAVDSQPAAPSGAYAAAAAAPPPAVPAVPSGPSAAAGPPRGIPAYGYRPPGTSQVAGPPQNMFSMLFPTEKPRAPLTPPTPPTAAPATATFPPPSPAAVAPAAAAATGPMAGPPALAPAAVTAPAPMAPAPVPAAPMPAPTVPALAAAVAAPAAPAPAVPGPPPPLARPAGMAGPGGYRPPIRPMGYRPPNLGGGYRPPGLGAAAAVPATAPAVPRPAVPSPLLAAPAAIATTPLPAPPPLAPPQQLAPAAPALAPAQAAPGPSPGLAAATTAATTAATAAAALTPPAAAEAAEAAAGQAPRPSTPLANPCVQCGVREARHLWVPCGHRGHCEECLPDSIPKEQKLPMYPNCLRCKAKANFYIRMYMSS